MKKYYRKSPSENIWVLGLSAGSPSQAAMSLLPKGSKIISIDIPVILEVNENRVAKHKLTRLPPNERGLAVLHRYVVA